MKVDELKAGQELDVLVTERVMGWNWNSLIEEHDFRFCPSTSISDAWQVVERLGKHAGDFKCCDGYFHLTYSESADHSVSKNCTMTYYEELEDGTDPKPWSAHFHFNMPSGEHCQHKLEIIGQFCEKADTGPLAICRAALKAVKEWDKAESGGGPFRS